MSKDLVLALTELRRDEVLDEVQARAASGSDPVAILDDLRQGMTVVGERYQKGDYFLSELMLSADLFEKCVAILNPYLDKQKPSEALGSVVLATLTGDVHDLGKNIFATLLRAQAFDVHDLGIDVRPADVAAAVRQVKADFVGFSSLITSSFDHMKSATDLLVEEGLREGVKVMIGGAVTTPALKDFVGADFQTIDACEGVEYCLAQIGRTER